MGILSARHTRHVMVAAALSLLMSGFNAFSMHVTDALRPAETSGPAAYGRFGKPFDIDPYGQPQRYASKADAAHADAHTIATLQTIAKQPGAAWFGHLGTDSVEAGVRQRVEHARKQGTIAVLVAYNIPFRDCGMYAAGELTLASDYKRWIRGFVRGLGTNRAVVIIEPDALAQTNCLTKAQRIERYALVRYAVRHIAAQGSWSYIDAGHSKWKSVAVISHRLRAAGVKYATGFSLNVSNFRPNDELTAYGKQISRRTAGAHFVLDTSRNGVAPTDQSWCNPKNKGLGHSPTADTGSARVDAYLWIKTPGASDGTCNSGPPAGAWFQTYAEGLAERAAS